MREVCCAGCDHGRPKKGRRTNNSMFAVVQSRKAECIDICIEISMLLDFVLCNHLWYAPDSIG